MFKKRKIPLSHFLIEKINLKENSQNKMQIFPHITFKMSIVKISKIELVWETKNKPTVNVQIIVWMKKI